MKRGGIRGGNWKRQELRRECDLNPSCDKLQVLGPVLLPLSGQLSHALTPLGQTSHILQWKQVSTMRLPNLWRKSHRWNLLQWRWGHFSRLYTECLPSCSLQWHTTVPPIEKHKPMTASPPSSRVCGYSESCTMWLPSQLHKQQQSFLLVICSWNLAALSQGNFRFL